MFVHGGGWRNVSGRLSTFLNGATEYTQKGYVTAILNYMMPPFQPVLRK